MNLCGYRKYLTSQSAPLPLTAAEEELRQIKLNEVQTHKHRHVFQGDFSNVFTSNKPFHTLAYTDTTAL